ncbi:Polyketide cyclase / dehydrase and lipid transport [Alteromonadaceae bacterium Bs31]|nr:Polyketide cyclase / dehydrase and lipid transport [Alteromonadaceae bacterium Bs31]
MSSKRHQLNAAIVINRPSSEVWSVLEDFDNVYQWAPGVSKSHGIGKQALGVGHGRHCVIEGFGSLDEYITQWIEQHGFTYSISPLGPLHHSTSTWRLRALNADSTRLEVTFAYELRFGIFGKLMHVLMVRPKLEKGLPQTIKAVKARVENLTAEQTSELAMVS